MSDTAPTHTIHGLQPDPRPRETTTNDISDAMVEAARITLYEASIPLPRVLSSETIRLYQSERVRAALLAAEAAR